MFAFWKYDTYPYFLGGEISERDEKGFVYIKSYQSWFKPAFELEDSKGKLLIDVLKLLAENKRKTDAENALHFMEKRDMALNMVGVKLKIGE